MDFDLKKVKQPHFIIDNYINLIQLSGLYVTNLCQIELKNIYKQNTHLCLRIVIIENGKKI